MRPLIEKIRARDPMGYALHRAIRAAVAIPAVFAFTFEVIGSPQVATFAAFGGFSLLLFVDFPGNWTGRLTSYLMLGVTGAVLIVLGTLASRNAWLAVAAMVVVGFVVLFAGTLSVSIAAAGRAALLVFILPVSLPGTAGDIAPRLEGWGIAVAVAIPAAMLVWPPTEHNNLRRFAAETCRAMADVITTRAAGETEHADELCNQVRDSLTQLRRTFRGTAFRPVGLTTGSRALVRLVDELEWLGNVVRLLRTDEMQAWPQLARDASFAAADVLRASAEVLRADRKAVIADDHGLTRALDRLAEARQQVAAETRALLDADSNMRTELPFQGHELGYAASLVGETVRWAGESDARPVIDRVLGRPPTHQTASPLSPAVQIATSQIERHSVWLQNSIRGAVGLGVAIGIAEWTGAQHSFWVVLGTLSVLRSSALSTGSTVLRALAGTLVGFAVGAGLVLAIGTSTPVLWAVLPIAVLVGAFAPEAISFAAGQAGFTVVLLILFNIIAPVGWKVGLVRIEDIGLGCGVSLVVGALLWPRGAAAAIGTALSQSYRIGSDYLESCVEYVLGRAADPTDELRAVLAAGRRQDDALRQYLAERGTKSVALADLTGTANGATRLRLAGEAICLLRPAEHRHSTVLDHLSTSTELVLSETRSVCEWYTAVGDALDPHRPEGTPPPPCDQSQVEEVFDVLRHDLMVSVDVVDDTEHAKSLLWTSLYLQDMRLLESRISPHITAVAAR
ncbi:MAG TPA: FUSC family protein [Mycobacteriales bacterium]|nr:FUSC family protein [Mycobacteriales bacterium]